jgi:mono/diheme cytochrome c family protein
MSKLGWLIGGVVAAGAAIAIWQAVAPPEATQGSMVHPDLGKLREMPQGAPIVEVALPEQLSPQATLGKRAFEVKCAVCHGINAAGQNGVAPPLVHKTYEPSHHSDMAFFLAAQNGVRAHHWTFGNMPPVDGLTRADLQAIVAYVRELQRANGIY